VVSAIVPDQVRAGQSRYLDAAEELGSRLASEAVWHQDRCTWLGDDLELLDGFWQVVHRSVDGSLYGGSSGIALFLARLEAATGDAAVRDAALGALRHALRETEAIPADARLGLYDGALGIIWAALEAGRVLGSDEIVTSAARLASRLADDALGDERPSGHDLIAGRAGTIVGLLAVARGLTQDEPLRRRLLDAAAARGDELCAGAQRSTAGWSWGGNAPDLCGLAHGASGPALALLELYRTTGEHHYRTGAFEAFRYERGWYDRSQGGWPDLRGADAAGSIGGSPAPCPMLWCHGAVGIGLVRIRGHQLTGDHGALAEAGAALEAALMAAWRALAPGGASGASPPDSSLCHGIAGTVELLACAATMLGAGEHLSTARAVADALLERTASAGGHWTCGVPGGDTAPGLMLGLAGVGSVLLRADDPLSCPPVGLVL
jgi:lantibiotic modifying enzyme